MNTKRLTARAVLTSVVATSSHFYFPSALKALRRFEPFLEGVPLGAQYCVLAQRPST